MRTRRSPALIAGVVLLLIPALAAPVAGANDADHERHQRTVAHWTPERMQAAKPRDFVFDSERGFVPAKPGKPGGGGGLVVTVTGASWTNTNTLVYRASGKVYFELGASAYICSGAVVEDARSGYSLVVTAAHCAYDETNLQFATFWMFIPEFDSNPTYSCAGTTYGCWSAAALVVHSGYANAGGFNSQATVHDYAIAVVGPGGKSGGSQLDATVGDFGIRFSSVADGTQTSAFGYPAAGKYAGSDLVYCAGAVKSDPYNSNLTYKLGCDMTGGSSGGPWLTAFTTSTGDGTLTSVNSYTYSFVRNTMHGPKFDARTQTVYSTANGATFNTIVT